MTPHPLIRQAAFPVTGNSVAGSIFPPSLRQRHFSLPCVTVLPGKSPRTRGDAWPTLGFLTPVPSMILRSGGIACAGQISVFHLLSRYLPDTPSRSLELFQTIMLGRNDLLAATVATAPCCHVGAGDWIASSRRVLPFAVGSRRI